MSSVPNPPAKAYKTGPTGTPISGPLVIDDAAGQAWDQSCDTLVIGCGLAGATKVSFPSQPGS